MDNPYILKSVFTVHEAAAAIHSITRLHKDDVPLLQSTINELVRAMMSAELACQKAWFYKEEYETPGRIKIGEVPRLVRCGTNWMNSTIARADLLAWCESRGFRPPLLFPDPPPAEKPLQSRERETLLSIIRALAELHGIKPNSSAYRTEAESLLVDLSRKGITEPCSEKTLSKHLATAFKAR